MNTRTLVQSDTFTAYHSNVPTLQESPVCAHLQASTLNWWVVSPGEKTSHTLILPSQSTRHTQNLCFTALGPVCGTREDHWRSLLKLSPIAHKNESHTYTEGGYLCFPYTLLCVIQDSGVKRQKFRTLETLIEHYRSGAPSDVSVPPLTDPLDKTQIQCICSGQGITDTHMLTHTGRM